MPRILKDWHHPYEPEADIEEEAQERAEGYEANHLGVSPGKRARLGLDADVSSSDSSCACSDCVAVYMSSLTSPRLLGSPQVLHPKTEKRVEGAALSSCC